MSQEAFESGTRSLCQHFYGAIAFIAYISTQPECVGFFNNKVAVAYSLYLSMHRCMQLLYLVCAVLIHEHYDSILLSLALVLARGIMLRPGKNEQ